MKPDTIKKVTIRAVPAAILVASVCIPAERRRMDFLDLVSSCNGSGNCDHASDRKAFPGI